MIELSRPNEKLCFYLKIVSILLLFYFLNGWRIIPMHAVLGLDLQCLWTFHHCVGYANSPYIIDGITCGDYYGRPMVYPPLHYWTFAWTRLLEFKEAFIYLAIAICGVLIFSYKFWVDKKSDTKIAFAVWILLFLQYPTIFQIERGSNDLPVYIWFLASLWAFRNKKLFLSGMFCALCASTKLYPVFLLVPLGISALLNPSLRKWVYGSIAGLIVAHVFTPIDSINYFLKVMPLHAENAPPIIDDAIVSHTIRSIFPDKQWLALSLFGVLWGAYIWRAIKDLITKPTLIFCIGIALSTYFAVVSWDYHLILVYPLLFYVFLVAEKTKSPLVYLMFIAGVVAFFFDRTIVLEMRGSTILTKLQLIWLSYIVFSGHKHLKLEPDPVC